MARCLSQLTVILSLCLLFQQFVTVLPSCVITDTGEAVQQDDQNEYVKKDGLDDEVTQSPRKRGWGSELLGLGIKAFKFFIKYVDEISAVVDLSVQIPVGIGGCPAFYPSMKANWEKCQQLDKEFKNISKMIDGISLDATIKQCYGTSSVNQYEITRNKMEDITASQLRAFRAMNPELTIVLRNTTNILEVLIEKKNSTTDKFDQLMVDRRYNSGLETALNIGFPALTLAMPGFKRIYKHIKGTVIGTKIQQLQDKLKVKIGWKGGSQFEYKKLSSSKFMGTQRPGSKSRMKSVVSSVANKYRNVKTKYGKYGTRALKIFGLGSAALSLWGTITTITDCKKKSDETQRSVRKMEKMVADMKELLENVTIASKEGDVAYDQILGVAWDTNFLNALDSVKTMMADTGITKDKTESTTIVQDIQAYIDSANTSKTPSEFYNLQRKLNSVLHYVPFTIDCHAIKGEIFKAVSEDCAEGKDTFCKIYEDNKNDRKEETARNKCQLRTGLDYINAEGLEEAWKKSVKDNNTIEERCLLNNVAFVDNIKERLQNGAEPEDAASIAAEIGSLRYKDDIETLLKTLPKPEKKLLPRDIRKICKFRARKDGKEEKYVKIINRYSDFKITVEIFNNTDCSEYE